MSAAQRTRTRLARAAALVLCLATGAVRAEPGSDEPQAAVANGAPAVAPLLMAGADVALQALSFLGVPYRYGGSDPQRGFDCSGLVRHVAQSVLGLDLPRSAEAQARVGQSVPRDALAAGDLVFFNTRGRRYSHVGIYIGDGRFVHAPARRGQVRVEEVDASYWRTRFNGARRLPGLFAPTDFAAASEPVPTTSVPSAAPAPRTPPPEDDRPGA